MQIRIWQLMIVIVILLVCGLLSAENRCIELSWDDVAEITLKENLSLKMSLLDEAVQSAEIKKAWGSFLPQIDYQWIWSNDELTQSQMPFPLDNAFIHSINLTFPLFTGGARYANLKMQKAMHTSIKSQLQGARESTVQQGLMAYYEVILAKAMTEVYQDAQKLAKLNLRQVESFLLAGTATELAVMQARTRYFEIVPQLNSTKNRKKLAINQLKLILNFSDSDSVIVSDDLIEQKLLGPYAKNDLSAYKNLAKENRNEINQILAQSKVVDQQKLLAISQFLPSVAFTASKNYYAYSNDWNVEQDEFEGYQSLGLVVQLPLFSGASRWYDLKSAGYSQKKMKLLQELTDAQIELEAEQSYYNFLKAQENLKSLKEAAAMAQESLRLANLYYEQGMSTQTDVLNAQLSYTQSHTGLLNGIFEYNTSQIALLKAIGDLECIWNN